MCSRTLSSIVLPLYSGQAALSIQNRIAKDIQSEDDDGVHEEQHPLPGVHRDAGAGKRLASECLAAPGLADSRIRYTKRKHNHQASRKRGIAKDIPRRARQRPGRMAGALPVLSVFMLCDASAAVPKLVTKRVWTGLFLYAKIVLRHALKGGMASRPGRRVVAIFRKGGVAVEICDLFAWVIKILPDIIKLALLVADRIKNKHRPVHKG